MNVWNKVFLGIIFVTAVVVVVLASLEFHIRNTGQKRIADWDQRIADTDERIARLISGADPLKLSVDKTLAGLSINELRGVVRERYHERGRAWFDCIARAERRNLPPALQQVVAQVTLTGPLLPGAAGAVADVASPDTLRGVVYVFEDGTGPDAGAFLGRFNVDGVPTPTKFTDSNGNENNGWRVTLVARDQLSDGEIEKILAAQPPSSRWAIYLTPPVDRVAGVFDQLTDEEKQMIPAELLDKFQPRPMPDLTDEESEDVDASVLAIWEMYRGVLDNPEAELANDFAEALDRLYLRRNNALLDRETAKLDIASYEAALKKAEEENEKMTQVDIPLEEKRVAAMEDQRDEVKKLLEQYEAEIARLSLQFETLRTLVRRYIIGITEAQLRATEKIEEQIKNAAQAQDEVR